ncbi:hypothetical protein jaqu_17150 [Jannaschia aquimarina]|uniref:Uncharacterized protein n=1 Tax=Jannaschia aquimarina TaxID=935700 RepID=A0A0D1CNZ4_9RHOB|nr:hypothetical protein jaqu_17150 [Jannaschia aquimarina]SNT07393.1 hypothetical protein SAMN05421775_105131 [Jannaschia aquimarina]
MTGPTIDQGIAPHHAVSDRAGMASELSRRPTTGIGCIR